MIRITREELDDRVQRARRENASQSHEESRKERHLRKQRLRSAEARYRKAIQELEQLELVETPAPTESGQMRASGPAVEREEKTEEDDPAEHQRRFEEETRRDRQHDTHDFQIGMSGPTVDDSAAATRARDAERARVRRAAMTSSQKQRAREKDAERKRIRRANRSESQAIRDRGRNAEQARVRRGRLEPEDLSVHRAYSRDAQANHRATRPEEASQNARIRDAVEHEARREGMSDEQRQSERDQNTASRRDHRGGMAYEQRQSERDQNTASRRDHRGDMTYEQRQAERDRDAAAHRARREAMTEEQRDQRKEHERFRRRSRQYKKGLAHHESFDPSSVSGGRHYFTRYTDDNGENERVCHYCNAWKFPQETDGCCCRNGLVFVPTSRTAPDALLTLFENPTFMRSIRAYNNVFAFTSMGASRSRPLSVDESVTRNGVYNFRVQGSVCHRMGSLLPPAFGRSMYAQVYFNDPDMDARVRSRMNMTQGLDRAVMETIDQMMVAHNPYTQEFINARRFLIDRGWDAYAAAIREHERRREAGEDVDDHDPSLALSNFLPEGDHLKLRLHVTRNANPGTHNTPTASEVAAVVIDTNAAEHRDIILHTTGGGFKRIFETSVTYDPLQYPLLFPYGDNGWTYDIPYVGNPVDRHGDPLTMSVREYEAYLLYDRTVSNSLILRGGRLTQQYCVDQWAKCEQERLRFIKKNQLQYRLETLQGLTDALRGESVEIHRMAADDEAAIRRTRRGNYTEQESAEPDAGEVGRKIIIPPKFTGGPRYMYQRFLDAMAIVRETGAPNLFITMTCNPNWPEIKENLRPGEKASDRPDIVARVFMEKLKALNKDLDEGVLGIQAARVHVVEYQKRGLPHAHILLILRPEDKPTTKEDVDKLVSSELPDKEKYPELYDTVISNMLHGPCGQQNPSCPCIKNGRCSKKFPKALADETVMTPDKYPRYKRGRRPDGILCHKGKVWDNATINQWVVPYNPFLSQKYNCHINVEVCATNKAIKYIYKYVYKGSDMTTITIEGEEIRANEILQYLLGRYIFPVEACMRLFMHPTQGSTHSVVTLPIHLERMSMVAYRDQATTPQLHNLINRGDRSMLTEFFELCARNPEATVNLLYKDVPRKYRWTEHKTWEPYKKYVASLGRLVHVSPQDPERFYLRLLLCNRRSPKSFADLRTVDGTEHPTYQQAALALGYLENDDEWIHCLREAAEVKMPYQLRQLFGIILVYSMPGNAKDLWDRFKKDMSEDHARSIEKRDADRLNVREEEVRLRMAEYKALKNLADYLVSNQKSLDMYGLPLLADYDDVSAQVDDPDSASVDVVQQEIDAYPQNELEHVAEQADHLNSNQRDIFDQVIAAVSRPVGGEKLFFLDGPGGTGKSFLLEQILAHVRMQRKVAIAVASSGIAATLLTGGHTAHSTFRIPLKLTETSTCSLSWQSQKAELIRSASLIIWDEAPMMNRACFEAVDRSLRDIMKNELEPFGGKVMVFSGDHRQILPVLKDATRAETIQACFKSSPLWEHLRQVRLTENMRVRTAPDAASAAELAEFSEFLLQIGEGRYPVNHEIGDGDICLPRDMCIIPERRVQQITSDEEDADMEPPPSFRLLPPADEEHERDLDEVEEDRRVRNVNALIDAVYPGVDTENLPDEYFVERAILAPTNASVRRINDMVAERLSGETKEYLSVDSLEGVADANMFEQEFLNSLNFSGIPPHRIVLKVGTPIIMIRNLNGDAGLCNGTRLRVVSLRERSIEASIMSGPFKGKKVFIPRIVFYSEDDDKEFPFKLKRKQFPVVPAFAMTINKAQGQSIHHVGIYLESPVFAHGQLYVALSRVTSRKAIKIAVDPEAIGEDGNVHTNNIVYREIFGTRTW
ncbi:helitron helicase-like protein [Phytophthora infestans T30-4]|uniref:ATP-dependent DNA helicase n=1 Tax=Phytophthora infestans (strain T30-4) TaxID=403677 RepID=D0NM14_PHYIT|nr:helitron helicase-like protein [Phytophthora infestans T30-4]EEY60735.1 helitron helicase-like protein [Phytophthora infestans T30-4]|eukprot:XP_002899681.1 helitron helicase-like protein [Phytophthora infestans T30-4]